MPRKNPTARKHDELLERARELKAVRVQVVTEKGDKTYKDLGLVGKSDEIQTRADGEPIIMKGKPGRKGAGIDPEPITVAVKEIIKRKEAAVKKDPILQATISTPDSPDVLHQVIIGLSEEAASLAFERTEAEREGKDSSGISSRRIQALRAVGDTFLKKMDQVSKVIDLDSQAFKKLFGLLIETLRESMIIGGYADEEVDTIVAKMATMINDEWKTEARNRMKQV